MRTDAFGWGRAAAVPIDRPRRGNDVPTIRPATTSTRRPRLHRTAPATDPLDRLPPRNGVIDETHRHRSSSLRRPRPRASACGWQRRSASASGDLAKQGPIKIWLSNNPEELAWGKAMVTDWNAKNPKEKVTAQEIPAGKTSEEVIGAAITAGNAPCLVFNTSPAAVPQFQKQGGLVALDDFPGATKYIEDRTGKTADQYKSPDGKFSAP